ncbi:hypothetical protein EV196_101576 [Mariniflexile fucanivorans]|uniref:Uncharacterized protein n=1 Tax=Mariniflexile fucanivorans TaxID=264023 RepID=A0A4R1RT43_9FLAO|nr:hypothetical protein [Mariniflexile fucanivorans]TCL69142.1 hypothetical protein EV196_101576 [Mariniflexile fucanivorans]
MDVLELNGITFHFPSRFEYLGKNTNANQHFFKIKKTNQMFTVSVRNKNLFEYYSDSLSTTELIKKYYNWESNYWSNNSDEKIKAEIKQLENNHNDDILLWKLRIIDKNENDNKWSIFLIGIIENKLVSMSLKDTKELTIDSEKIKFLKEIYENVSTKL